MRIGLHRFLATLLAAFLWTGGNADAKTIDALMFLSSARQALEAPAKPLDTSRVPMLSTAAAVKVLSPFLGREIDQPTLERLRDTVQRYYASVNRPFVAVTIPPQDVTGGVVRVLVIDSVLGGVAVAGNRWFDKMQYREAITSPAGEPIDSSRLDADMNWLNSNPYRHARVQAGAGVKYGTTDLTLTADDRFPVSFSAGIDDTGNASTGLTRLSTGFDWGNAFFRGDDFTYNYETTPDGSTVRQHGATYTTWLPSHASLSLTGTYGTSRTATGGVIGNTGLTETASLRYTSALPGQGRFSQQIIAGADYKSTNNNLLFGGTSVFPTTSNVEEFSVAYAPAFADPLGTTSATVAVYLSPGGLSAANSDAAFSSQQAGARARYTYLNASLSRSTPLTPRLTWDLRIQGQLSTGNLLASEELNLGYPTIRGFYSGYATRDEGLLISTQWSLRPVPLGVPQALRLRRVSDGLASFVFVDYGTGWNHQDIGGASTYVRLLSAGPGFTYALGPMISGRFDYGFVLQHFGLPAPGGQADLGAQIKT